MIYMSGFIAQLVRASHRYFEASLHNCKSCLPNCEDQSSFDSLSAVQYMIYFIYIISSLSAFHQGVADINMQRASFSLNDFVVNFNFFLLVASFRVSELRSKFPGYSLLSVSMFKPLQ